MTVRIQQLRKEFGKIVAVDGMTMEVPDGQLMTFLGPSGCGKTTTLRMIAGLENPTDGEVWIDDDLVASSTISVPPERRNIGMVFQSYAVWPHMTVFENVAFPLRVRHLSSTEVKQRVGEALDAVELGALAQRHPPTLSGGQQQRVALARAIVFRPSILLCDEPLSNLDANLREQMRTVIRDLQLSLGITCIYVTHDQREALAVSDLVTIMFNGVIIQTGQPEEIYRSPKTQFVARFLGHNIFEATVAGPNTVEAFGSTLTTRVGGQLETGATVEVAFRPEAAVVIQDDRDCDNLIRGNLRVTSYTGDHFVAEVDVAESTMRVRTPSMDGLTRGAGVAFRVPPDELHVLSR